MRLIDADAVPQEFWKYEFDGKWRGCTIKDLLDSQPTITPDSGDGWILCSERMPEEEESCWAKFYGTDKWRKEMFRKRSEFVDVTVVRSNGEREVALANTLDGKWSFVTSWFPQTAKVVAWKLRTEPYMGEIKDGD